MSIHNNYVAILAGGIGVRFWPESRQKLPKQFLDLLGTGRSLLQETFSHFKDICPIENIYIVTLDVYEPIVALQVPQILPENIVCEPSRKNTAPSAAYITHKILAKNPDANIVVSPADHLITEERIFQRQVFEALDFVAHHEDIAVIGVKPITPNTNFGYIQYEQASENEPFYKVKTFVEKPNLDLARTFLRSGDFLWNSGIFVWNGKTFVKTLEKYFPELNDVFIQAQDVLNTEKERKAMELLYAQCTTISIDYAILERARNLYVLSSRFGWSDLGNWESVYEQTEKDYLGNAVQGKNVMIIDAAGCMVKATDDKLVILQGLDNFLVIDTDEVLIICERSNEHQIKDYITEIKRKTSDRYL